VKSKNLTSKPLKGAELKVQLLKKLTTKSAKPFKSLTKMKSLKAISSIIVKKTK